MFIMISDIGASGKKMMAADRLAATAVSARALAAEQNPKAVGMRLRRLRKFLRVNQHDIAAVSGTTQPSWSDYENGKTLFPAECALRLCNYEEYQRRAGLTMDWLYRNDPQLLRELFAKWLNQQR